MPLHIGYGVSNEGLRRVCPVAGIGALNTRDNEVESGDSNLSARGGKIFIRDDVGYRAGIHMKEYQDKKPALVIGGTAQDFLGEYMVGGILVLLGLNLNGGEGH